MIYAKHDFTRNFVNAIGYDDNRMLSDMIIDELARLIVEDKKDVVKLLRNEGINVTVNDNEKVIANFVTSEISKGNIKFTDELSKIIAKKRVDPATIVSLHAKNQQAKKSADSTTTTTTTKKTFWQTLGNILSNEKVQEAASTIISSVLQSSYNKSLAQQTAENQAALDERLSANQMYSASGSKKTWMIVGIVAGVLIVGTIVTILVLKNKKRNSNIDTNVEA